MVFCFLFFLIFFIFNCYFRPSRKIFSPLPVACPFAPPLPSAFSSGPAYPSFTRWVDSSEVDDKAQTWGLNHLGTAAFINLNRSSLIQFDGCGCIGFRIRTVCRTRFVPPLTWSRHALVIAPSIEACWLPVNPEAQLFPLRSSHIPSMLHFRGQRGLVLLFSRRLNW